MNDATLPESIAILGATSQIAQDLISSYSMHGNCDLFLFARRPDAVTRWLETNGLQRHQAEHFDTFGADRQFDAIINFVGSGNPAQVAAMGASIFDVTMDYDGMALEYLRSHPSCRYVFMSSGTAYCSGFEKAADEYTRAEVPINNLQPQDWYAVAKLYAECRHRALPTLPIVDIRIFNYFSHTQDISSRYLITDILRAIRSGETLVSSPDNIIRDYIGPDDLYQLISLILAAPPANDVLDCYTRAPVDKMTLLSAMQEQFGLKYEIRTAPAGINATGIKMNYFSTNRRAEKYGYVPSSTSLETVLHEARLTLANRH